MAEARKFGAITPNVSEMHRQWLALVDCEGPFLAIPSLKRVWPAGIPDFRTNNTDRFSVLVDARKRFETAWEELDRAPDDEGALENYREKRDEWVETVLRDVIGWSESLQWGPVSGVEAKSPNQVVSVTPQAALVGPDGIGAIIHVIDPTDSLRETPSDVWAATPIDRVEAMLRESGISIAIVTDGRWWGVVHATTGFMPASGIVDALTWTEEPRTRDAFFTLLSRQQLIGGEPNDRLAALFVESIAAAEEITEALGSQVRQAVELLVQSFSESAAEAKRRGMSDPLPERPHEIYEAAVTVMMRIVFLLFAEERGLLPTGELFEHGYGIAGELDRLITESTSGEEVLDISSLTWHRLLATSRALFQGASFENLRMPAYGGSLFDPNRFSFLTASNDNGSLVVSVNDRVMLHVLESVQVANLKGEARRISFRDIDVEQIGYIYEGLLGYTCVRVDEPILGIIGKTGVEPEIPLSLIEELASANSKPKQLADAFIAWVKEDQPSAQSPSSAALSKAFAVEVDAVTISALSQSVGGDEELKKRITPWLGAVRTDLRGQPFVVQAGGLLVAETPSRKNSGAHYTPKSLAEEVVLYALQPLCYSPGPHQTSNESEWKLKSSDDILNLKIADIACGSGAFLVAAARYLSDRLVEAWIDEDSANRLRKDLHVKAVRQVVANCLYGADINDMAVEMCKLSLWLVSLDRNLPFSFVDDKIFLGNSLLGITSLDQLRSLHIDPSRVPVKVRLDFPDVDIDSIVAKAVELRENLATEIDESDPARTSVSKQRQLAEFHRVTNDLRQIADGVIAAGLPLGGKPGNHLDEAYSDLRLAVKSAFPDDEKPSDAKWLDGLIERGLTPSVNTDYERWQPLHWVLEAPDVMIDHGGFDAVIGNPPFLGGKKISGAVGTNVREWFANTLAKSAGNGDLVAYFFLRAFELLESNGMLGLIATNTVAQGDTREIGLDQMSDNGFRIFRSIQSRTWPAVGASLKYAGVWGTSGPIADAVFGNADGVRARQISSFLEPEGNVVGLPKRLEENRGICFQGCIVLGKGFVVDRVLAEEWIREDQRNAEVLYPYLNGDDLNSDPGCLASRYCIDFGEMSESQASSYSLPWEHVDQFVRHERQSKDVTKYPRMVNEWWKFWNARPGLRSAIQSLEHVSVIARVSKTVIPVTVSTGQVFSEQVCVFAVDNPGFQALLTSSLHRLWAVKYGSTLGDGTRYTPTDVFETFPLVKPTRDLERLGQELNDFRKSVMTKLGLGLTDLYNGVNSVSLDSSEKEILEIREMHRSIDSAAMAAYGWSDLALTHGIYPFRNVDRWSVSPRDRIEILDRLLAENQRRAAIEEQEAQPKVKQAKSKKPKPPPAGMEAMF